MPAPPRLEPHRPDHPAATLRHLPCIEHLARRLRRRLLCYLPLEQMASVALIGPTESQMDPRRPGSLDGHAAFRTKAAVLDALRAAELPRDPRAAAALCRHRLGRPFGRDPKAQERT